MKLRTAAALGTIALAIAALVSPAREEPGEPVLVAHGEVEVRVTGPGTVQARVPVTVAARISALVLSVHADHGAQVKAGQLLAVLDDRDLSAKRAAAQATREALTRNIAAAHASLSKARAELELAANRYRRDAELQRAGFISPASHDASALAVQAARAALDNSAALLAARQAEAGAVDAEARYAQAMWSHTRIHAPMDALVIQRAVEPGSMVAPGAALFRLVDPATLWIAARIDEALVARIEEGMPARIRLRSGEQHAGRVARISRQSDAATRELEVDVAFDSPPARFAIDQEAEVSILAGVERGPVVPVAALVRRDGRQGVMLLRDGRKVFQPVRVGATDGRRAIIADGLDQGEKLAAWTSH